MEIKLGSLVKDKISGFTGIAVGRTVYLYGCIRISVDPIKLDNGKIIEGAIFDEPQLQVLEDPLGALKGPELTAKSKPHYGPRESVGKRPDAFKIR